MQSNLTFEKRTALKELSQSTGNKVYSYNKGTDFVILNNNDFIQKIEEQIGESVISNTNPISALSKCYFLSNSEIRILKNSVPIELSFTVVLSERYVQNLEHKATAEALTLNLALKTYRQFVDYTHARLKSKEQRISKDFE